MGGVLSRGLVIGLWVTAHVSYLALLFGFSLVPPAITEQYANGPLPTTPGSLWLYMVFILSWLTMLGASVWVLPFMLVSNTRCVRGLTSARSRPRMAWLAAGGCGLVLEAAMWITLCWPWSSNQFSGSPAWPALAFAVGFPVAGLAMIRVLAAVPAILPL
jgi:hypothetical protein